MRKLRCPHCFRVLTIDAPRPGVVIPCPKCFRSFRVPAKKEAVPESAPAPPPAPRKPKRKARRRKGEKWEVKYPSGKSELLTVEEIRDLLVEGEIDLDTEVRALRPLHDGGSFLLRFFNSFRRDPRNWRALGDSLLFQYFDIRVLYHPLWAYTKAGFMVGAWLVLALGFLFAMVIFLGELLSARPVSAIGSAEELVICSGCFGVFLGGPIGALIGFLVGLVCKDMHPRLPA